MNKGKKTVELERVKVGRELPGLAILYILTCCLWGGYHEYVSCVVSAALAVWLLLGVRRTRQLVFGKSVAFAAPFVLALAYLVTGLWAQDQGMALIGFVKFLPLPLFVLNLLQRKGEKENCLKTIPWVGVGMTILHPSGERGQRRDLPQGAAERPANAAAGAGVYLSAGMEDRRQAGAGAYSRVPETGGAVWIGACRHFKLLT